MNGSKSALENSQSDLEGSVVLVKKPSINAEAIPAAPSRFSGLFSATKSAFNTVCRGGQTAAAAAKSTYNFVESTAPQVRDGAMVVGKACVETATALYFVSTGALKFGYEVLKVSYEVTKKTAETADKILTKAGTVVKTSLDLVTEIYNGVSLGCAALSAALDPIILGSEKANVLKPVEANIEAAAPRQGFVKQLEDENKVAPKMMIRSM